MFLKMLENIAALATDEIIFLLNDMKTFMFVN